MTTSVLAVSTYSMIFFTNHIATGNVAALANQLKNEKPRT